MPRLSLAKLERHLYAAADRLRQEGLDAATYKDYIFGLLFLKRCSDQFDAERTRIVANKVEQGVVREKAEEDYGEDPDYYDGFFVPERARWESLTRKLADASEPFGAVLDKALGALSEANESLEHVLDHISFMRTQGNKRVLSDEACKDLVRHFSRQRLRNEDFQFSDLLGAAYEFLINMFAESAGKKGGDFYTPRDVIRMMARLLKPSAGMSVYDPTCGSGGVVEGWVEGWVDAVADALEDDEAAGPAFDPFGHPLVLAVMGDYLERIAETKREIARLKGEKEAFEQSNAPEDLEEEEQAAWNYPKDLERQRKEIKSEHKPELADLAKKNKAASLMRATPNQKKAAAEAREALRSVLEALAAIDEALAPYGGIKDPLAAARAEYRGLLKTFVVELKRRCEALEDGETEALVLRLLAGELRQALDKALAAKRQELLRFVEGLWDKYGVTLETLRGEREKLERALDSAFGALAYGN